MTGQKPTRDRAAATRTLADVSQQIAARHETEDDSGSGTPAEKRVGGSLGWADLEDDVVGRLAADGVIATNRALSQRSLRDFLS